MIRRKVIKTGYEELDNNLGGGLVNNSTNFLVEDGRCLGELFLASILKKRVENGDKGIVDCFSIDPDETKDFCEKHGVSLKKYEDSIHFIDLTSKEKNKLVNMDNLDEFATAYINLVSKIKAKKNRFNIVLSLSNLICRFNEEEVYRHLKENLKRYEACKRTSIYLIKRDVDSDRYINRIKDLFSSVILLKQYSISDRFLSVKKSPLRKTSEKLIRYGISRELENRHGVM